MTKAHAQGRDVPRTLDEACDPRQVALAMAPPLRRAGRLGLAAAALIVQVLSAQAQAPELSPADAAAHVGQKVTICGVVEDARYLQEARTQPTFLNFGGKFPQHQFTAVIFGKDRAAFGSPESTYLGKRLCVWGPVTLFKGKPQIVLKTIAQIDEVEK